MNTNEKVAKALETFLAGVNKIHAEYMAKNFPTLKVARIEAMEGGKRYVRVIFLSASGERESVYAFVDTTNGDVLKADGWKKPAKHARGNIFAADNGLTNMGPYGPVYLRGPVYR